MQRHSAVPIPYRGNTGLPGRKEKENAMNRNLAKRHIIEYVLAFLPLVWVVIMLCAGSPGKNLPGFESVLFIGILAVLPACLLLVNLTSLRKLLLLLSLAVFGFMQMGCPMLNGTVEIFLLNLVRGGDSGFLILKLAAFIIAALVFSRYYCGWICPQGIVQEFVHHSRCRVKIPYTVERKLKYFKYAMLAALLLSILVWHFRLFHSIGPFKVLFNLKGTVLLTAFLAFWLVVSVYIERPYCRYFCPGGAFLALLARVSLWAVRLRKPADCINCLQCVENCPTGAISPGKNGIQIQKDECIACMECVRICPQQAIRYDMVPGFPVARKNKV
jgi:polyferredoxin